MDGTTSGPAPTTPALEPAVKVYKSRPGALAWCFRKSRDLWKGKYQALRDSFKRLTDRARDLTKSRERWRLKAERAHGQLAALEARIVGLQAEVTALTTGKKPDRVPAH
jgi:hypothetical protein